MAYAPPHGGRRDGRPKDHPVRTRTADPLVGLLLGLHHGRVLLEEGGVAAGLLLGPLFVGLGLLPLAFSPLCLRVLLGASLRVVQTREVGEVTIQVVLDALVELELGVLPLEDFNPLGELLFGSG